MDASEHPADLYRRGCEEPGRVFDTPRALLEDARLDREQKLDILQRWAHDLRELSTACLLYTSPSPRDGLLSRMPSSA